MPRTRLMDTTGSLSMPQAELLVNSQLLTQPLGYTKMTLSRSGEKSKSISGLNCTTKRKKEERQEFHTLRSGTQKFSTKVAIEDRKNVKVSQTLPFGHAGQRLSLTQLLILVNT